jgi:hypothetical protein
MSDRFFAPLGVGIIVAVLVLLTPTSASAQWTPPLTPDGRPDLQGVWVSKSATPLERPKALEGRESLTNDEVIELKRRAARILSDGKSDFPAGDGVFLAALANVNQFKSATATGGSEDMIEREFETRTSLIVDPPDGRVPPLTQEGQQIQAAVGAARLRSNPDGPEDVSADRRCLTFGLPRVGGVFGAGPYSYYQIVQTPGYVVLTMEFIHEARIIPLDGRPHLPPSVRQWNGDSRGWWEGNTLVVESSNFSPKSSFMGSAGNLHLIERFTRVAPDTLEYEVTFSDPTAWVKPWTAMLRLKQTEEQIYEVACHEGNFYSMQGILAGARREEKAAEEAAKSRPK